MENRDSPLLKNFSRIAFLFIAIVTVVLSVAYRSASIDALVRYGEQSNVALTQAVSNTLWPVFKSFAPEAATLTNEQLKNHPRTIEMDKLVHSYVRHTPILKIKFFNLTGKTIYSTDPSQLGTQKPSNYGGSIVANTGRVLSELEFEDSISSIQGELKDRTVVSSYLPIRDVDASGNGISAVIEVYFDVTDHFAAIKGQQLSAFFVIAILLFALYASLYLVVRRADRIIHLQSLSLKQSLEKIEEKTAQLNEANRYS